MALLLSHGHGMTFHMSNVGACVCLCVRKTECIHKEHKSANICVQIILLGILCSVVAAWDDFQFNDLWM